MFICSHFIRRILFCKFVHFRLVKRDELLVVISNINKKSLEYLLLWNIKFVKLFMSGTGVRSLGWWLNEHTLPTVHLALIFNDGMILQIRIRSTFTFATSFTFIRITFIVKA